MRSGYEPLMLKYGVDVMFFGHVHAYERTKPVYDYKVRLQLNIYDWLYLPACAFGFVFRGSTNRLLAMHACACLAFVSASPGSILVGRIFCFCVCASQKRGLAPVRAPTWCSVGWHG